LDISLGETLNHKLQVLVRVDIDPGHLTLEVTGCLTQANYPLLLDIVRRDRRVAPEQAITVDLHNASHLDPEVLMHLRQLAERETGAGKNPGMNTGMNAAVPANDPEAFQLRLAEPAELPICLHHGGLAEETQTGLDNELHALLDREATSMRDVAGSPAGEGEQRTINGLELSEYLEGELDPAATVRALPHAALGDLTDALYRHLDTRSPAFGAHTWYALAAEELRHRQLSEHDGPAQEEVAAG
jgi:hypothetical protein